MIMDEVALLVVETDERVDIRLLAPPPVDVLLSRPAPSLTQVCIRLTATRTKKIDERRGRIDNIGFAGP